MVKPAFVAIILGFSVLAMAGCTTRTEPKDEPAPAKVMTAPAPRVDDSPPVNDPIAPAGKRQVTIHVKEMTERLHLT